MKEICERCEEGFSDLLPTTLGMLCESCAWAVIERDQDGELGLDYWPPHLDQAPELEAQAQDQQDQW